jgi:hypothetical protein
MGLVQKPDTALKVDCLIRLKDYTIENCQIVDGATYLVVDRYEHVGTSTEMDSAPVDINRVGKWNLICKLAADHPFESEVVMKQRAEYDLKETDSRKQVPMYRLAMMIGDLKFVVDEIQRREIDGHWTELIAASRRMHRSIVWKANQAISSSITPAEKEDLHLKLHDLRDSLFCYCNRSCLQLRQLQWRKIRWISKMILGRRKRCQVRV